MKQIFFALFAAFSLVHLYASYMDNVKLRHLTKSGILVFLTLFYVASPSAPSPLMIAALVFSLLGDVALQIRKLFFLGGVFFICSHLLFITVLLPHIDFASLPFWVYLSPLVYAFFIVREMRDLKNGHIPKKLFPWMCLYLCVNALTNCAAFMLLISRRDFASALIFAGAVLFFVSDSILFLVRFHKQKRVWRRHFPVMLTYILAELFLVLGVLRLE